MFLKGLTGKHDPPKWADKLEFQRLLIYSLFAYVSNAEMHPSEYHRNAYSNVLHAREFWVPKFLIISQMQPQHLIKRPHME